jgi:protoheme IX farnesyltransferase
MKAEATSLAVEAPVEKSMTSVICELVKMRLTTLVLITTVVGFYLGERGNVDLWLMLNTLLGTALVASGAAALNQLIEAEYDARMRRTEDRPLPSGRMSADAVLIFGGICSTAGLIWLALGVNLLTAVLGAATLLSYLFVYTPLKRITPLNTVVGAIPGALPPLMGWTAATGQVSLAGWSLFAILFFWQLPHFLAIAWMYRDDYARAGFAMLPVVDREGRKTGQQAVSHTLGLLPVSLAPFLLKLSGPLYCAGALLLGILFLWCAVQFSRQLSLGRARALFFMSIIYLPVLLALAVFDKVKS